MCMTDVYRVHRIPGETLKVPRMKTGYVHEDVLNLDFVCASARLMDAVESLEQ